MNSAKAAASTIRTPRCTHSSPPPEARPATTASSTIPRMSSKTAAPRMILAVRVASTRKSPSTRAVIPTLVATMAAPTKIASLDGVSAPLHVSEAQNEGHDDAGGRHQKRLASHPDQILRTGFKAGAEQHENGADFRDGMDGIAGIDPAQGKRAESNSGQNLAEDRRQPDPFKQLSRHLRGNEDGQELQEKLIRSVRHDVHRSIWE